MAAWLDTYLLDNTIRDWVTALTWAAGATVAVILMRRFATQRLAAIAARTPTAADDALIAAVRSVRKRYVLLIALGAALSWLSLPDAAHYVIKRILIVVCVIQAIRTGSAIIEFWAQHYSSRHDGLDRTTTRALSYAGRVVVWVTIVLVGLEAAGFRVQTLLTGLGVGGIAIALAVQNILGDLFAAMSIVLDKPFVVGDAIAVDQFEGNVVHIGLKSTRVRSVNGEEVVFSNADLLKSRLRNLSRREGRRYVISFTLAPRTLAAKLERVPAIIAEVVAAEGRSTLQRSHVMAVGLNGIEVETAVVIEGPDFILAHDIRQAIIVGALARFEKEGIALAQSVHVTPA
ncbi:MAG: mechanosensitive ion channel [Gemmatimonadetes bacterium]|nr:mechanosensitive ion channel [Gemmatimonadota bacterium]